MRFFDMQTWLRGEHFKAFNISTNPHFTYGNERHWFAGSGGQICSWLLFPSVHIYLPIVIK